MWGGSLSRGHGTGISVLLVIGRMAQSPGVRGLRGEAGEERPTLTARHVTLMPRQCWFQGLGVAGGHMWYAGSTKVRVVPTSRWFELHVEGETGRACRWHRMDAGSAGWLECE